MKRQSIIGIIITIFSSITIATPHRIILFRHGEKTYNRDVPEWYLPLSSQGQKRAKELAEYFLNQTELKRPGLVFDRPPFKPDAFFGLHPRTLQTLAPTAQAYNLPIIDYFPTSDDQYTQLTKLAAKEILKPKYDNKTLIISWEHLNIPVLAKLLGVKQQSLTWPHKQFDHFWIITFDEDGSVKDFEDVCQPLPTLPCHH